MTDVNDNAPSFTNPTYLKVHKERLSDFVNDFELTDPDDWSLNHGPPFRAFLPPDVPSEIAQAVSVKYESGMKNVQNLHILITFAY